MTDEHALPRPNGVCSACQGAAPVLRHDPSGRLALYCEHNQAGGVLSPVAGGGALWIIYTPVSREEFVDSIAKFGERFRDALGADGASLQ